MNIFGFENGSDITLISAGGVSLVADGTGPNLQTMGLTAGANVTLTPGATSLTIAAASGAGVYLPLDGTGTMGGDLKMGTREVSGLAAIRPAATNFIVGLGAMVSGTGNVLIGDSGAFVGNRATSSSVVIGGGGARALDVACCVVGSAARSEGANNTVLGAAAISYGTGQYNVVVGIGANVQYANNCVAIGQSAITQTDLSVVVGNNSNSSAAQANIYGSNLTNATAGSLIVAASTNIRASTTTCDLGTTAARFQNLHLSGNVAGPTNSRLIDDIVSNTGASTSGNLASLSGTTGKVITDSGVVAANVLTATTTGTTGNLSAYSAAKVLVDSGVIAANVVTGPVSSVLNRIAVFAGTTGKALADGGSTLAQYALLAGATFTGTVAMGANAITGTGAVSAGTFAASATTASTTTGTGSIVTAGGLGVAGAVNAGGLIAGTRFNAVTPMCYISYAVPIAAIAYTANTAKLIDLAGMTEQLDVSSEFTTDASTGKVTYTGTVTKYVEVNIDFAILPAQSAQTIVFWVSKNSSPTQVCQRNMNFTASTPSGYIPLNVTMGYVMATNDTVQLASQYSATATINLFECQYRLKAYC